MAVNPLQKQQKRRGRGRPFAKGQSGNPAGRPPGSRNQATLLIEKFLIGEAAALAHKLVDMALDGDAVAMRLCLDRLIAPLRERPLHVDLPPLRSAADLAPAMAALTAAAAAGALTPGEAGEFSQLLETYMRAVAAGDFERRIEELEQVQREAPWEVGRLVHAPGT
ncbi:MAG TPA: DUF5681 domain-containing protein [Stellaceae bacterium]|nr:DUF5681 domain-containing protein [Stellaceae bacterium]